MSVLAGSLLSDYKNEIRNFQVATQGYYPGPSVDMGVIDRMVANADGLRPHDLVTHTEAAVGRARPRGGGLWGMAFDFAINVFGGIAGGKILDFLDKVNRDYDQDQQEAEEITNAANDCAHALEDITSTSDSVLVEVFTVASAMLASLSGFLRLHPYGRIIIPLLAPVGAQLIEQVNNTVVEQCRDRDDAIDACFSEFERRCEKVCARELPPEAPEVAGCNPVTPPPASKAPIVPDCPEPQPAPAPTSSASAPPKASTPPAPEPLACPPEQSQPSTKPAANQPAPQVPAAQTPTDLAPAPQAPEPPKPQPVPQPAPKPAPPAEQPSKQVPTEPANTNLQDCPPAAEAPQPKPVAPDCDVDKPQPPQPEPQPDPQPEPQPEPEVEDEQSNPEECVDTPVEQSCTGILGLVGVGVAIIGIGALIAFVHENFADWIPPVPEPEPQPEPTPPPPPAPEPEPKPAPKPDLSNLDKVPEPTPPPKKMVPVSAPAPAPAPVPTEPPAAPSNSSNSSSVGSSSGSARARKAGQW